MFVYFQLISFNVYIIFKCNMICTCLVNLFFLITTVKHFEFILIQYCQADVYLMRNSVSSGSDVQFHCRTHLGHVVNAGDTVIGYVN